MPSLFERLKGKNRKNFIIRNKEENWSRASMSAEINDIVEAINLLLEEVPGPEVEQEKILEEEIKIEPIIDFICSYKHYIDHAINVWNAIPEKYRGQFITKNKNIKYCESLGIEAIDYVDKDRFNPILFVSERELDEINNYKRPHIYLEHGCGQTYNGMPHLNKYKSVVLILTTPTSYNAAVQKYNGVQVECVSNPKMDTFVNTKLKKAKNKKKTIAFSHHWNQKKEPERMSAWPWDKNAIENIVYSNKYNIIIHKHPLDTRNIEGWANEIGAEFVSDWNEVCERADVYVCDNSSSMYEFAALDRPVVTLSPPFYRREITHGLRFWSAIPGIEVCRPEELQAAIEDAISDNTYRKEQRKEAVKKAFGKLDGKASANTANIIIEYLDTLETD